MMASGTGVALEKERLTTRIAALKASVMRHDESIAALTSSAATSESGMPSHARATVDLLALLKVQLAELHEVLLDKERSIQELRLKVCRRCCASPCWVPPDLRASHALHVSPATTHFPHRSARSTTRSLTPSYPAGTLHASGRGGASDEGSDRGGEEAAAAGC